MSNKHIEYEEVDPTKITAAELMTQLVNGILSRSSAGAIMEAYGEGSDGKFYSAMIEVRLVDVTCLDDMPKN